MTPGRLAGPLGPVCSLLAALQLCAAPRGAAEPGPAAAARFTDVAADVGVTLLNVSGDEEQEYVIDTMMGGVAFLDHDGDGDLDLYVVNGSRVGGFPAGEEPRNALYRNDGEIFADATAAAGLGDPGWGMGVAVADHDNDGDPDVFITNYGRNVLYENRAGGAFTDVTGRAGVGDEGFGTGCAFFDSDRDGDLDLYVANYVDFRHFLETTPQRRHEWRGLTVHFGPRGLRGGPDVFYRNDGDGLFADATEAAGLVDEERLYGLGVVAGDLDVDGDADLFVANDTGPNYLYRNRGDGVYEELGWMAGVAYGEAGEAQGSMGIALGDYDDDEDPDILVTNFWEETNTLYRNDGGELFTDVSFAARLGLESFPYLAWGTEFFDYDNDGDKDLFVANGHIFPQVDRANLGVSYAQGNQLFENLGDGAFREISEAAGPGLRIEKVSRGAAFGDYDDDGDVDILVLNLNDAPTLLRNDGGHRGNWLLVRAAGVAGNRDGIGAKVRVRCGEAAQAQEVRSGSSYLSSNDPRLHFGLGDASRVDEVRVSWPGGLVETWRDLEVNQILVVREGSGAPRRLRINPRPRRRPPGPRSGSRSAGRSVPAVPARTR